MRLRALIGIIVKKTTPQEMQSGEKLCNTLKNIALTRF